MAAFSIFLTAYSLMLFKARRLFFYLRNIKEKSLLDTVPNFFRSTKVPDAETGGRAVTVK